MINPKRVDTKIVSMIFIGSDSKWKPKKTKTNKVKDGGTKRVEIILAILFELILFNNSAKVNIKYFYHVNSDFLISSMYMNNLCLTDWKSSNCIKSFLILDA